MLSLSSFLRRCVCRLLVPVLLVPVGSVVAEPLNIAFIHQNPVGEGGWTLSHEQAREKLEAFYGDAIRTTAVDGIAPGVDAERVLTKFARSDYDLVFATSFGFLNPTQKVARRFPAVTFEHASGYRMAKNLGVYQIRAYQGRYLSGMLAGATTQSQRIGYVGSFAIPEVIRGINAFTLGVQAVNPDAVVELIWVNSWSDAGREREATEILMAKGVDVVTHHTETASVMSAAAAKGVYAIGYQTDRSAAAGEYHLASVAHNWYPIYQKIVQEKLDGTWQSKNRWIGVEENASELVSIAPFVSAEVLANVESVRSAMAAGEFRIFEGPIKDQAGEIKIQHDEVATDDVLMSMEWLVQGVLGKLDS